MNPGSAALAGMALVQLMFIAWRLQEVVRALKQIAHAQEVLALRAAMQATPIPEVKS